MIASDWPKKLKEFLLKPENSRNLPGQESVSIHYGQRVPKILLLTSKLNLITTFLSFNPLCPFKKSVLLREIPPNFVLAGNRDFGLNVCTIHTNMRHIFAALLKVGLLNCPNSCRIISSKTICNNKASFNELLPLTWSEECVVGTCRKCPDYKLICPEETKETMVLLPQWCTKMCDIKKKKINSLFNLPMKLDDIVKKYNKQFEAWLAIYIGHQGSGRHLK